METTASFGYWMRRQRKALDLTQQALAERVGCSLAAIKKIESDERRPSRQTAERLADILGVPASQRELFVQCARGLRPVDQLVLAREPAVPTPTSLPARESLPHNLPVQLTSFIGREHELSQIKQLLTTTHLLTLTGPGGTGKTRLALQLAGEVLELFADGVWLVELAPLADPSLVPQTIMSVFGLREQPNTSPMDTFTTFLRARQLAVILDNCEHLIAACAQWSADLLQACPHLKIIASSREALGITGETVYRVPSLTLPNPAQATREALEHCEAGRLFVERAMAVNSHFALTDVNALAVAPICHRLDGIPLALELAATRVVLFSPEEIAARLDDRFRLLTGGSRMALERHQTLRALFDWSYDLLSAEERRLFRELSVFVGSWSFEAAQAICPDLDVLNLLTQLVNKSLAMVDERAQGTRYRFLETIHQYGREKLLASGEVEQVRDRHLDFFLCFAEQVEPKLRGAEQLEWLERAETEHDNLRAAMAWSLESGKSDRGLQLAGALYYFWLLRSYFSEGQKWLDHALALSDRERIEKGAVADARADMAWRAKALYGVAWMHIGTIGTGTIGTATVRRELEESLRLWRKLGDTWWMAVTSELIGFALCGEGDIETARARLEEGVSLARQIEDPWPLALCLICLGDSLTRTDLAAARRLLEEGVLVARRAGDKSVLSEGLRNLGSVYYMEGDLTAATQVTEVALAEARAIGSPVNVLLALYELVVLSCLQNDPARASEYCLEFWALGRETGSPLAFMFALVTFGFVDIFSGRPRRGVGLLAAFEPFALQHGMKFNVEGEPVFMAYKQALEKAQAQLDQAAFEAAWTEGQRMTLEQALALATENESEAS
jgi:predicted ATPase/transcriptional regulator with XRE-family HTH domain